ncbi:hypothetical protein EMIHUDRAFT_215638 [Emiliania huxleyi CCMP1516]|uniref:Dienelactone hydrolase domain-containing protein n=2 Tax=Emiliania huxleyi TaxID=2903 RepID=A0A0D3IGQ1_EMIH1|nr:hypothetical protein EMIHUDRAFT_215638 [Emiliania huxleyi CCMP1516]EOD10436.1 hypothetical protein EMIHUDRAFT_215638 [Emiliania huxleyi CCMP1516]|eukprot:XP_005762865.1 hypothetical protein EMIHUDRAFT_215638 [Emiliania huxleyi CCMP1516]
MAATTPSSYTMLREPDPRVEFYHTETPVPGTKTTFADSSGKLPVLLFQSGYGHSSDGHAPFLERIAAEGCFLVIAPDRSDDQQCGALGILGFLNFVSCSAVTTDGSNLALALSYAKDDQNQWMERADLSKVAMAGFSMGAAEAINAQARLPSETKALLLLSPSILVPAANVIAWNCCLQPITGGQCFLCSDTPVGPCGTGQALRQSAVPAFVLSSENDMLRSGVSRAADILGERDCYGSPLYGASRHFALADDVDAVSSAPVAAFLKQQFCGGAPLQGSDTMVEGRLNSKAGAGASTTRFFVGVVGD